MQINLTFDPSTELDEAKALLESLGGDAPAPAAKAPAKKTTPARKTAAAKPAPEPEEEETEEEADGPTLEDAIARAQELVGEKRTDEVKAAVKKLKVERVSKLTGAKIAQFLELVADDEDADDAI
jgi:hypothetical protein